MSYENKYNDFKAEAIIKLKQLLEEKGYDRTEDWNKVDEDGCFSDTRYELPLTMVGDEDGFYSYYVVQWDGESFLGYNREDMDYWFEIEDLDLFAICELIDYINEQN